MCSSLENTYKFSISFRFKYIKNYLQLCICLRIEMGEYFLEVLGLSVFLLVPGWPSSVI